MQRASYDVPDGGLMPCHGAPPFIRKYVLKGKSFNRQVDVRREIVLISILCILALMQFGKYDFFTDMNNVGIGYMVVENDIFSHILTAVQFLG